MRWSLLFVLPLLVLSYPELSSARHTRIYAVVLANDEPQNFMAGSSIGSGLWQSDDTGKTWTQLGWKHIKAFSMDYHANGRVLYLAAGNGVLKSTDHGQSWKVMTDWRVAEVLDVMVYDAEPSIVIAATAYGIIRSTDAGVTWEKSPIKSMHSQFTSRLYKIEGGVVVCSEVGLHRSTDAGKTWEPMPRTPFAIAAIATTTTDHYLAIDGRIISRPIGTDKMISIDSSGSSWWDAHYQQYTNRVHIAGHAGIRVIDVKSGKIAPLTGPKNSHAITSIGEKLFVGTLGEGIWTKERDEWRALALPKSQVWRLVTATIP